MLVLKVVLPSALIVLRGVGWEGVWTFLLKLLNVKNRTNCFVSPTLLY